MSRYYSCDPGCVHGYVSAAYSALPVCVDVLLREIQKNARRSALARCYAQACCSQGRFSSLPFPPIEFCSQHLSSGTTSPLRGTRASRLAVVADRSTDRPTDRPTDRSVQKWGYAPASACCDPIRYDPLNRSDRARPDRRSANKKARARSPTPRRNPKGETGCASPRRGGCRATIDIVHRYIVLPSSLFRRPRFGTRARARVNSQVVPEALTGCV